VKKLKKYAIRSLIGIGALIAVLLISNAVAISVYSGRVEKKIAAIRAAGDPVSLADLAPAPTPSPEQNGAIFLRRTQGHIDSLSKELHSIYAKDEFSSGMLTETDVQAIEAALQAYPDIIPLLRKAAECPDYDSQYDVTTSPQEFITDSLARGNSMRAVSRLLAARTYALAFRGKHDEAMATSVLLLQLVRQFATNEPLILNFLVPVACRDIAMNSAVDVLSSGRCQEASYKALDDELARHDSTAFFERALKTERALGMAIWQAEFLPITGWPARALFLSDEDKYLNLFDEQLALSSKPYADLVSEGLDKKDVKKLGALSGLIAPQLVECRKANDHTRARVRCLRVLNAVLQNPALSPQAEALVDPFTGEAMLVKQENDGWLVYSVGANLKDDGGDFTDRRDVGFGPVSSPRDRK
jgi:hypothetical protein